MLFFDADSQFLGFDRPARYGSLRRRDYIMAGPLVADSAGWLNLSDAPGMGYTLDEARLTQTLIG
jgi:hypothetical protein